MVSGRRPLEADAEPKMDPEALVQCPYDKAHQIRVSRLPYHLVKCQRVSGAPRGRDARCRPGLPSRAQRLLLLRFPQNNPQVARSMEICPFNARHRIPRAELQRHIACCPDQRLLFDSQGTRPAAPQLQLGPPSLRHTSLLCSLCPKGRSRAPVTRQSNPRSPWPGRPHHAKRTGRQVSVLRVPNDASPRAPPRLAQRFLVALCRGQRAGGSCTVYPQHHCERAAPPRRQVGVCGAESCPPQGAAHPDSFVLLSFPPQRCSDCTPKLERRCGSCCSDGDNRTPREGAGPVGAEQTKEGGGTAEVVPTSPLGPGEPRCKQRQRLLGICCRE